jgi:alpha-glucosidase
MLSLCRRALELRKANKVFSGSELEWYGAPPGCLAFRRKGGGLICGMNASASSVALPPGEVLLASGPLSQSREALPPDTAVWLI